MGEWLAWSAAMERALVGPRGFYRGESVPSAHFRTSVTAAPELVAQVMVAVVDDVRAGWGSGPDAPVDLVDMGAGGGELLARLAEVTPPTVRLHGVDIAPRPSGLPSRVSWSSEAPEVIIGLVVAHEYLDNVPLDVAQVGPDRVAKVVLVDTASGEERLGGRVAGSDAAWISRWWPLEGAAPGTRAEIGRARDAAWSVLVQRVRRGLAIAVDYDHVADARPPDGTLTGYRQGRVVAPVPDGSCDLTAHVALDACAVAGAGAGATSSALIRQSDALRAYGVDAKRPPIGLAHEDALGYVRALSAAGSAAELLDRSGLGGFGWLVQGIGQPVPARLRRPD